ncbi:hypothetical protein E8E15_000437 [Penicillium rubens]|nr:hypothetical protein E8E15_000437 [Penicillium rubens]
MTQGEATDLVNRLCPQRIVPLKPEKIQFCLLDQASTNRDLSRLSQAISPSDRSMADNNSPDYKALFLQAEKRRKEAEEQQRQAEERQKQAEDEGRREKRRREQEEERRKQAEDEGRQEKERRGLGVF